jgi:AraC-like DNA-binding protein
LETTEPDLACAYLDELYGGRLRIGTPPDRSLLLTFAHTDAGSLGIGRLRAAADLEFETDGRDDIVISCLRCGRLRTEIGRTDHRFGPGDVYLASQPRTHRVTNIHDADTYPTRVTATVLIDAVGQDTTTAGTWKFLADQPTADGARRWWDTRDYLHALLNNPIAATPLVVGSAARLAAATILAIFPNTLTGHGERAVDRTDAHPAALRRAIAFIDSHLDQDIGITDIARAARVTARTVQLAFRRHLDTTPTAYLRRTRLRAAHRDLLTADPSRGDTVAGIASRWGFATPGHFRALYRATYGTTPRETLTH